MKLTSEQIARYHTEGFLLAPNVFSPAELAALHARLPQLYAENSARRVKEDGAAAVRSVYGSHLDDALFGRLARHPRLVGPARQLLGNEVYVYQFKVNAKLAFVGDVWQWHQDHIFWLKEDGLPRPDLTSAAVFLDDVNEFNGPMLFIPGSHQEGTLDTEARRREAAAGEPPWISNLTAALKYTVDPATLRRLVAKNGIVAPKGPAGSVLFFHPNTIHASVGNISPFDRALAIATYCDIDNVVAEVANPRPEFLSNRAPAALVPVADGALLEAI